MGYKIPLTNLQNVAPGNTATLKCPVGQGAPTYDQIRLELSGSLTPIVLFNWSEPYGDSGLSIKLRDGLVGLRVALIAPFGVNEPNINRLARESNKDVLCVVTNEFITFIILEPQC